MRTDNMKVEFSPKILDRIADDVLAEYMKIEMFRILLKHPYQRQPSFATKALLTMASNVTIADVYEVPREVKKQMSGAEQKLPGGLCFEEYYNLLLQNTAPNSGKSGDEPQKTDSGSGRCDKSGQGEGGRDGDDSGAGNSQEHRDSQISELWEENEEACCNINEFIEVATASNNWGTVAGKLQGLIKASLKVDMDYRKMLSLFKTSVINRLFKYGVEKLDVLQFDAQIQGEIEPLKKARKTVKIMGRGGTSFQPAADYYCEHPEYDGLIYFTDGYAPPPKFNTKRPIDVLWVLCSRQCYMANSAWIRKIKRNRGTFIPRSE